MRRKPCSKAASPAFGCAINCHCGPVREAGLQFCYGIGALTTIARILETATGDWTLQAWDTCSLQKPTLVVTVDFSTVVAMYTLTKMSYCSCTAYLRLAYFGRRKMKDITLKWSFVYCIRLLRRCWYFLYSHSTYAAAFWAVWLSHSFNWRRQEERSLLGVPSEIECITTAYGGLGRIRSERVQLVTQNIWVL